MPAPASRKDIADAVIKVVQGWHFDTIITEETNFEIDIPIDKKVKGLYYYAIRLNLEKLGYEFTDFKPEDCENAATIRDMIDAVWKDLDPDPRRPM